MFGTVRNLIKTIILKIQFQPKSYLKDQDEFVKTDDFKNLDPQILESNLKVVLRSAVKNGDKKHELAHKILDHLYTNEYILDNEIKFSKILASNLDKVYFNSFIFILHN